MINCRSREETMKEWNERRDMMHDQASGEVERLRLIYWRSSAFGCVCAQQMPALRTAQARARFFSQTAGGNQATAKERASVEFVASTTSSTLDNIEKLTRNGFLDLLIGREEKKQQQQQRRRRQ